MNKAVTEGLVLMPPPFSQGLAAWSSGNGTPGAPSYNGAFNAAIVPADPDFGTCLELLKTEATQRLRWTGQVPILPGLYLRVRVRVKAISGPLPSVRIAGFAANAGGGLVGGVPGFAPATALTQYGQAVEVSAIIGTGARGGVDLNWNGVAYGHLGLDLTGPTGGLVRIEDIIIEDVSSFWLRDMLDWVDVRDHGALGNGTSDDFSAFMAAIAAAEAAGRGLFVPSGSYFIGSNLTIPVAVRFEGTLVMAEATRLLLMRSYDFPTYAKAFGNDETGLRKGLQALFFFTDHAVFDLKGRQVRLTRPIDLADLTGLNFWAIRRMLSNGILEAMPSPQWNVTTVTAQGSYNPAQPLTLTGVTNVANVPVGARITGAGVGREVYVRARNIAAQTLTLSQPLFGAAGTQIYTFTHFPHMLDLSGFGVFERFEVERIEFLCKNLCSAISLPTEGRIFQARGCTFNRAREKAITSIGLGCQGMLVDNCLFQAPDMDVPSTDRTSIALNVNALDVKLRDNLVRRYGMFAVMCGSYHIVANNHFYHGDDTQNAVRRAGIVFTNPNAESTVTGNYVDNCALEFTNEHSAAPAFNNQFSFSGISITGNVFLASNVLPSFRFIVVKPYGPGHFVTGMVVQGNAFRVINGVADRADGVDTSFATLDYNRFRNVIWQNNSYNNVAITTESPLTLRHQQNTADSTWTIGTGGKLPFSGRARTVPALTMEGPAVGPANELRTAMPYTNIQVGPDQDQVRLIWPSPTRGRAVVTIRVDNPL